MHSRARQDGFTLIELLIVVTIITILSVVVVLKLNPQQLLAESADANRLSDVASMDSAIGLYEADQSGKPDFSMGTSSMVFISVPDSSPTCANLGLPALSSGYSYGCASSTSSRNTDGTGWIPLDFKAISSGSPFASLPTDPTNTTSSGLFYTYARSGLDYEVTAVLESNKYRMQFVDKHPIRYYPGVDARGSSLAVSPLYNPSGLIGYWPLNEGNGTTAVDNSNNQDTGAWSGTPSGSSGYYGSGNEGTYAGVFDGTDNAVSIVQTFGGMSVFTVSLWVKTTDTVSNGTYWQRPTLFGKASGGAPSGDFGITTSGGYIGFWTGLNSGGDNYYLSTTKKISDNKWHFVTLSNNGSNATLYLDGVAQSSLPTGLGLDNTERFAIGARFDQSGICGYGGGCYYQGTIEGVRFYNRALSPAEVFAIYNAEK